MSDPHDPHDPTDPAALTRGRQLAADGGQHIVTALSSFAAFVRVLAVAVAGTGIVALLFGLLAWRHWPVVMVILVLVCLPAVIAPLYVVARTQALARAASHPRELMEQAQDLVGRVRDSTELGALASRITDRPESPSGRPSPPSASRQSLRGSGGRLRSTWRVARLASTVVGQAQPDPERHRLLVAFTPARLRRTWLAATISVIAWPIAALVLVISVPVLALTLIF